MSIFTEGRHGVAESCLVENLNDGNPEEPGQNHDCQSYNRDNGRISDQIVSKFVVRTQLKHHGSHKDPGKEAFPSGANPGLQKVIN